MYQGRKMPKRGNTLRKTQGEFQQGGLQLANFKKFRLKIK